ncbi:dockerin type I domain-containing protein, partial [Ruminococcus sp. XPD3002]|uniref:dockerin type I domain-containing protein n=1 Tax=Ruminococcus sp. XPD3002 TaxID=1452269 RepID=UPI000923C1C9
FFDSDRTISNVENYYSTSPAEYSGVIRGYDNSTAQAYAEKYNYKFESLGAAPEDNATESGDLNSDGKIDANDATLVLVNYSLLSTGEKMQLTESQQKAADVNGDGKIDSSDATTILQYYSYLSTGGDLVFKEYMKQNGK